MGEGDPPLEDLDALIRRVDERRWLSSRYVADTAKRADLIALYAYERELTRAVQIASNPLLAEIRLTWWREVLDQIYGADVLRRHPVVEALATAVRRRAIPRALLESTLDAQIDALDDADAEPTDARLDAAHGAIMVAALHILDPAADPHAVRSAGRAWGLARERPDEQAVRVHLAQARRETRALLPEAFPAVAHATLASHPAGPVRDRLRLAIAVARGRV